MFSIIIDASDLRRAGGQWASFQQIFGVGVDEAMQDKIAPMLIQELTKATPMSDSPVGKLHAADQWGSQYQGSFGKAGMGTIELTNTADYLKFVISGVSGHMIEGAPLAFFHPETNSQAYANYVWHPGFGPNDFLKNMVDSRMPIATGMIAASIALSLKRTIR